MEKLNKQKNRLLTSAIAYFIASVLFVGLKILNELNLLNFLGKNAGIYVNMVVQIGIVFLVPFGVLMLLNKESPKQTLKFVGVRKVSLNMIGWSFLMGIIMYFAVVIVSSIFSGLLTVIGYENPFASLSSFSSPNNIKQYLIGVVMVCVLPGFCEEFLTRGVILSGVRSKMGDRIAIVISAVAFGLLHMNINQAFYTTVLGLVAGLIVYQVGSIWPAVIIHFTSNLCSITNSYLLNINFLNGRYVKFLESIFAGSLLSVIFKFALISILIIMAFAFVFSKIYKLAKARQMHTKIYDILKQHNIEVGPDGKTKFESDGQVFIDLKNAVIAEMASRVRVPANASDFLVPRTERDKYKPSALELAFIAGGMVLTGLITIATFIWGII